MKVFIATSQREGSSGFEWRLSKAEARAIFEADKFCCDQGRLMWFDTRADDSDGGKAITVEISGHLHHFEGGRGANQLDYFS